MDLVRFSFFIFGVSINKVTDYETLEQVQAEGLVEVAEKCIDEIKKSLGVDIRGIPNPYDYLKYCSFVQLAYSNGSNELIEKNHLTVK